LSEKTFKCAACQNTVTEPWDDAMAEAEFRAHHPGMEFDREKLVIVCDGCYSRIGKQQGWNQTVQ
jgi:DNA-directed RNA polymerase subunit RPC12/RpoP